MINIQWNVNIIVCLKILIIKTCNRNWKFWSVNVWRFDCMALFAHFTYKFVRLFLREPFLRAGTLRSARWNSFALSLRVWRPLLLYSSFFWVSVCIQCRPRCGWNVLNPYSLPPKHTSGHLFDEGKLCPLQILSF